MSNMCAPEGSQQWREEAECSKFVSLYEGGSSETGYEKLCWLSRTSCSNKWIVCPINMNGAQLLGSVYRSVIKIPENSVSACIEHGEVVKFLVNEDKNQRISTEVFKHSTLLKS